MNIRKFLNESSWGRFVGYHAGEKTPIEKTAAYRFKTYGTKDARTFHNVTNALGAIPGVALVSVVARARLLYKTSSIPQDPAAKSAIQKYHIVRMIGEGLGVGFLFAIGDGVATLIRATGKKRSSLDLLAE